MSDAIWTKITEIAVELEKIRAGQVLLKESAQAALDEHGRQIEALRNEIAALKNGEGVGS